MGKPEDVEQAMIQSQEAFFIRAGHGKTRRDRLSVDQLAASAAGLGNRRESQLAETYRGHRPPRLGQA